METARYWDQHHWKSNSCHGQCRSWLPHHGRTFTGRSETRFTTTAAARLLLNEIEHDSGVTPLETRELTEGGRRNVIEYVVWVLAIGDVGRIYPETKFVSLGMFSVRYVDGKLPIKPNIQ